jgi:hypothetical protein
VIELIQIASILLAIVGAWLLAFGLKIRGSGDFEGAPKGFTGTYRISQRPLLFWAGMVAITLAAILQIAAVIVESETMPPSTPAIVDTEFQLAVSNCCDRELRLIPRSGDGQAFFYQRFARSF